MQLTEYFLPRLAWPGLAAPGPAKLLSHAQPFCVLVPAAGGRTCSALSDKTSQLLSIPSVCGLVNINKARLQSGGKWVSKGGPGNWGVCMGI